jgi:hypothetical protein
MPSSVIRRFHYQPDVNRLVIEFQSGRRYGYSKVPPETYAAFRAAHSRGAYFNAWIRDHYPYECLDDVHSGSTAA